MALLVHGLLLAAGAHAGTLDHAAVSKYFPEPYYIGERDKELPVWPLFRHNIPQSDDFVGYVYESIDLAPIAGYSGTPPNLLVAITPEGNFITVKVVSHNEPIFNHGVEESELDDFVAQYKGLSVKQNVKVSATSASAVQASPNPVIDGVAKATVSVRIMNRTVLASSLKVARAKLGLAPGRDPEQAAKMKADDGTTLSMAEVTGKPVIIRSSFTNEDVAKAFGPAFSKDVEGGAGTDERAGETEIIAAYVSPGPIGRALLGEAQFTKIMRDFREGDHAILVASRGRYGFRGPQQRIGAVPDQLAILQDGLPIDVTDALAVIPVKEAPLPQDVTWTVLKVALETGYDPTHPSQIVMRITRKNSEIYPRRETKDFPLAFKGPADYFEAPVANLDGWQAVWHDQRPQIALTSVALLILTLALALPKQLTANSNAFSAFRMGFLALTLVGLGWWGQGQLSINNILGVVNAAKETGDFAFLLYDPVSLMLWAFVLVSLVIFGRGTFCGWLCPFGALQEFTGNLGRKLGVPQLTIPYAIDRKLRLLKYAVLGVILVTVLFSTPLAETFAEVEPFKTAITLGFDRAWPFVAYAVVLLVLSMFVFKGFCLYLCPLGAALALLGRVRRFDWIPRRAECGSPCQLCTVRCRYGAIEPKGQIKYDECFQCLDCVAIYHDAKTCVPRVLERKGRTMTPGTAKPGVKPRIKEGVL